MTTPQPPTDPSSPAKLVLDVTGRVAKRIASGCLTELAVYAIFVVGIVFIVGIVNITPAGMKAWMGRHQVGVLIFSIFAVLGLGAIWIVTMVRKSR